MAVRPGPGLSPAEWAVLGAVTEGPTYGFAVAQLFLPEGELGRVWTLPRPVVYQTLKKLIRLGWVREGRTERSDVGPIRTMLIATPAGRAVTRKWLVEPVDHVRDVRTSLLLKLALLDRADRDPGRLIEAQRSRLSTTRAGLQRLRDDANGFERVVAEWRLASSKATIDFLEAIAGGEATTKTRQ